MNRDSCTNNNTSETVALTFLLAAAANKAVAVGKKEKKNPRTKKMEQHMARCSAIARRTSCENKARIRREDMEMYAQHLKKQIDGGKASLQDVLETTREMWKARRDVAKAELDAANYLVRQAEVEQDAFLLQ